MRWQSMVPAAMFLAVSLMCFQRWWSAPPEKRWRILPGALITLGAAVAIVVVDLVT